jgi:hypothetical protein
MDQPLFYSLRITLIACLVGILTFTLLPQIGLAQQGSGVLYLPLISSGQTAAVTQEEEPTDQPENPIDEPEAPIDELEQSTDEPQAPTGDPEQPTEEAIDAELLAETSSQLPEPIALRAAPGEQSPDDEPAPLDSDGDGVPDAADNCPYQPNPPVEGAQMEVCGTALRALIDDMVFLSSRIFPPTEGLDPHLARTQPRERIHALLHVLPNDNGVVLASHLRTLLESHGVTFLGYVPHNTFYVSLPRNPALMQQLVALEPVYGLSALRPHDKVAPQVRVEGPLMGRNADGTLSLAVDFFADAPQEAIEALLAQVALASAHQFDQSYHVTVANWDALRRLAIQDIVYWIDDLPDPEYNRTQNAQTLIGGQTVSNTLGFRGEGIVVSVTELELVEPLNHPDMDGRITHGNNPIFGGNDEQADHAQMVSAILIADETTFPDRAGLLPAAELISYATDGLTLKAKHFGVNEEAREQFGALLSNNSWGPLRCGKRGEYHKRGKFFDRAVYDVGITVVTSAGNGRGPDGDFAEEECESDLYSLPHPVAKNDIAVGNWDIDGEVISPSSSAGPAADGRLKPDLVAPGQEINTIGWSETNLRPEEIEGSGTSAAAPVASGVVGWLGESFANQGESIEDIPPARFKAILVHTAKDVGPSGPDFVHGYGLIQADKALRIAEEWSLWGHEDEFTEESDVFEVEFNIDSPMSYYRATLVWDDEEGEQTSTMALKNDLDLTLVSPSGHVYYSYDLLPDEDLTSDTPTYDCWEEACQDRLNNVEMVQVNRNDGEFVETGLWRAVVDVHRLVSDAQSFTLVLTPPCPVVIDDFFTIQNREVTLTDDLVCEPHGLEPSGVVIEADNVDFNCDGHAVRGGEAGINGFDGSYVGIRVLGDNVTVRNCDIRRFDVGIKVGQEAGDGSGEPTIAPTNTVLLTNTLSHNGSVAIELLGSLHTVQGNAISQMIGSNGKGISVRGDGMTLRDNQFHTARTGGELNNTIGILVHPGTAIGMIQGNSFDGGWWYGIRLRGLKEEAAVRGFLVDLNIFEGIEAVPIELLGDVRATVVSRNFITAYGSNQPAIHVAAQDAFWPQNNVISANIVLGFETQSQLGIVLWYAVNTQVSLNILNMVAVGISDESGRDTSITFNVINPQEPPGGYITAVGIRATRTFTMAMIADNRISFSATGIEVDDPVAASTVARNTIDVTRTGIRVQNAGAPLVIDNGVTADGTAISLSSTPRAVVRGNAISNPAFAQNFGGIVVGDSDEALVTDNEIISPTFGVKITGTVGVSVTANTIDNPGTAGIVLNDDESAWVDGNTVNNNTTLGVHYKAGVDAVLSNNTVVSSGAGIGIRLGLGTGNCPLRVDNVLVENNILIGGAQDIEVLCDVGAHTLSGNQ